MYPENVKLLVLKMLKTLTREQQKNSLLVSINKPVKRAAILTGIKEQTINRWMKKSEGTDADVEVTSSKRSFQRLDNFDEDVIMRAVYDMFDKKIPVSTKKLQQVLEKDHGMELKKSTVWKVMRKRGLVFRAVRGNRKILMEQADLQRARCKYLRAIREERKTKNMVYLDETWVNATHTPYKEWVSEDGTRGRAIPVGKGQRIINLDAIDPSGFVPGCNLLFKSISTDNRDYHTEMNSTVFEDWTKNKLLPALKEKPSCIVMDNASYHSRICPDTAAPTTATRKAVMQDWLTKRGIPWDKKMLKPDLYNIIKHNKPEKIFVVDEMIKKEGHSVLRLPPYHCNLNPIENIWALIKRDIAANNTTFKIADIINLAADATGRISQENISNAIKHAEKIEQKYWQEDGLSISPPVEPVQIPIDSSSESSDSDSETDSE